MVRVAINGMGRIGRLVLRRMLTHTDLDVVAVNASYPPETIAHLVKYDTVHGRFSEEIRVEGDILHVAGRAIRKLGDRDPERLPWGNWASTSSWKPRGRLRTGKARRNTSGPGQSAW